MAVIYGGEGIDPRHRGHVGKTYGNVVFRSQRISKFYCEMSRLYRIN